MKIKPKVGNTATVPNAQAYYVRFEVYNTVATTGGLTPPDYLDRDQRGKFIALVVRFRAVGHIDVYDEGRARLTLEGRDALHTTRNALRHYRMLAGKRKAP